MHCMVLKGPGQPLTSEVRETPTPGPDQYLIEVSCCAVCRTDLHVLDGDLPNIPYPIIPGHEIVGQVVQAGKNCAPVLGQRVGVPWLGGTCGHCHYCEQDQENLCDQAVFTGYQQDGGFASHVLADHRYCFALPEALSDEQAAPLLCAGLIGYRSLKMAGNGRRLGLYGFGAAAHIICQVAVGQGREVFAFTREGDTQAQQFALKMGAKWAGSSDQSPPEPLDAAIIFAPVGALVPSALAAVRKGGTVVCGGIHMSAIPSFPYALLWGERHLRSVANLTRADAQEFLALMAETPVNTQVECFSLDQANLALEQLRSGQLSGAAVLRCHS